MKTPTIRERILDFFDNHRDKTYRTSEIADAISASLPNTSRWLKTLSGSGYIQKIKNGYYAANDMPTPMPATTNQKIQEIADALRQPDSNKKTIDRLLNIFDSVLDNYEAWIKANMGEGIDFAQQLLFIDNFKDLTAIGDKLMKRWALEHIGYDTNSRQAQEDAKAKTAAREKAEVEDAPLKDRVVVVGKYDPKAEALIDAIPSSLEEMSEEETEKAKV